MAKKSFRKVISIRQPWAWLIVHGYKDIENRSWQSGYRGECLIHAPQTFDSQGYKWVRRHFPHIKMPQPPEFERGGIVGRVEIVDCVTQSRSPWFVGPYGYILAAVQSVPFVPAPGRLGFFNLQNPVRILLCVEPDTLLVNDARTSAISVSTTDLDGIPIEGISLTGRTKPRSLGIVSAFDDTSSTGETTAVWHAGNRKGRGVLIVRTEDGDEAEVPIELIRPPKVRDPKSGRGKEEDEEEPEEPEEEPEEETAEEPEEEPNGPDDHPPGPDEPEPEPPRPDEKEPPPDHPEPPPPQGPNHGTKGSHTPHGDFGNRRSPFDLTDLDLDNDDEDGDDDGGEPGDKDLGSGG